MASLKELEECTWISDQIYYEKMIISGDLNAAIGRDLNDHLQRQIGKAAASDENSRNTLLLAELITEYILRVDKTFSLKTDVLLATSEKKGALSEKLCTDCS